MGCSGRYLYYGVDREADGADIYALDLNTGVQKHVVDGIAGLYVQKKKIADGTVIKVTNAKLYYCKVKFSTKVLYKQFSCSLTGKNRKALSDWITTEPKWSWS